MEIHFSHSFEIVTITASHEACKNPIALKCLCFPIGFSDYENLLFPCLGGIVSISVSQ